NEDRDARQDTVEQPLDERCQPRPEIGRGRTRRRARRGIVSVGLRLVWPLIGGSALIVRTGLSPRLVLLPASLAVALPVGFCLTLSVGLRISLSFTLPVCFCLTL